MLVNLKQFMVKYFETLVSKVFVSMYKSEQQQLSKVYN